MYVGHLREKHLWLIFNSHLRIRLRAGCADRCMFVFEGSYYYLGQLPETISFAEWNVYLDATTVGYYKRRYKWGITIQDSVCFPVHHGCLMIVYCATFILYYWKVSRQWPQSQLYALSEGSSSLTTHAMVLRNPEKTWDHLGPPRLARLTITDTEQVGLRFWALPLIGGQLKVDVAGHL